MICITPPHLSYPYSVKDALALFSFEEQNFKAFFRAHIPHNCVLIVEYQFTHGEVLCGLVHYMLELGYQVDVLLHTQLFLDKALDIDFDDRARVFATHPTNIEMLLHTQQIQHYEFVLFNTLVIYQNPLMSILNRIPCRQPKNGFLAIEHNGTIQYNRMLPCHRIFSLLPNGLYQYYINTYFFGTDTYSSKSWDTVEFLISGRIAKDLSIILDFFREIRHIHTIPFRLSITGNYNPNLYNLDNLEPFIHFMGYIDYQKLYQYAKRSHFILCLLDANNPEDDRYLYDFSGSLGLSYGFGIIPIIHNKFAPHFMLDSNNALIYEDGELFRVLLKAFCISKPEMQQKISNLQDLAKQLHKQSLLNITQSIQTICPKIQYSRRFVIKFYLRQGYLRLRRRVKLLYLYVKYFFSKSKAEVKKS